MALWGAGLCPLHPPRLNLSGTGYPCRCGTRRGAGGLAPARHWLSLPLWYPAGGRGACPRAALAIPATVVSGGGQGGLPPRGTGYPCRWGTRRGQGGLPPRGTGYPCRCGTRRGAGELAPCGTGSPCPGGEDHLKRRSSSPPVPPLLGCRHCLPVPCPNRHATRGHR